MVIYENNDVKIELERADTFETKVNVNGANLIYISSDDKYKFEQKLKALLDDYRI